MNDVLNFTYRNIILLCNKSKKIIARKVLREYYPYSQISFEKEKKRDQILLRINQQIECLTSSTMNLSYILSKCHDDET